MTLSLHLHCNCSQPSYHYLYFKYFSSILTDLPIFTLVLPLSICSQKSSQSVFWNLSWIISFHLQMAPQIRSKSQIHTIISKTRQSGTLPNSQSTPPNPPLYCSDLINHHSLSSVNEPDMPHLKTFQLAIFFLPGMLFPHIAFWWLPHLLQVFTQMCPF